VICSTSEISTNTLHSELFEILISGVCWMISENRLQLKFDPLNALYQYFNNSKFLLKLLLDQILLSAIFYL
jgi:hypothetical protein